jgi:2-hydroxychromene-2-carboxylate isomerase
MPLSFAVTWDYRCPFARIAHLHLVEGLLDGADWEVTFLPFSLGQVHVAEGDPDIWDRPEKDTGLLALQAGTVVRDQYPERFLRVHRDLFDARHVEGVRIDEEPVVRGVLEANGVDADDVFERIADGTALAAVRKDHEAAAGEHGVWGVPTFVLGEEAVFVRLMHAPEGDAGLARRTIERVVGLMDDWPDLNEYKHTSIRR